MKCPSCGKEIPDYAQACVYCWEEVPQNKSVIDANPKNNSSVAESSSSDKSSQNTTTNHSSGAETSSSDEPSPITPKREKPDKSIGVVTCVIVTAVLFGGQCGMAGLIGGALLGLFIGLIFCRKKKS